MKIILFKKFSLIEDVKVLKEKYQESFPVATLKHQVQLILPTGPCPIRLRETEDKFDLEKEDNLFLTKKGPTIAIVKKAVNAI